jgi:biofilm PGA synthesis N-glycosyltransferase PgaC
MSLARQLLEWGLFLCIGYLLFVTLLYVLELVAACLENIIQVRANRAEDYETAAASRFSIPVSILAAVHNEEPIVVEAVRSELAQDYAEFEVVVVDDGSTDRTLELLIEAFDLRPVHTHYRRVLPTQEIRQIYRSTSHSRLTVVDKVNGGKADALNCGINLARYRYVCGVDGDTVLAKDALLRGMRLVQRDPEQVVGVTSNLSIMLHPEEADTGPRGYKHIDRKLLPNFQHLDYVRSFYNNRLAWTRLNTMLCTVGAFHIWRRDLLLEIGGFDPAFTCEDIELTFRVHERFRREERPYRIVCLRDHVGVTEGPARVKSLISQRARWQRVIMETVWHYRHMMFNPRYGSVGLLGTPFYLVSEVLAPLFELLALVMLPLAVLCGVFDVTTFVLFLFVIAFVNGLLTTVALGLDDLESRSYAARRYSKRNLAKLILLGPVDLFLYRPILIWARLRGAFDFVRGAKGWDKFERNARAPVTTS